MHSYQSGRNGQVRLPIVDSSAIPTAYCPAIPLATDACHSPTSAASWQTSEARPASCSARDGRWIVGVHRNERPHLCRRSMSVELCIRAAGALKGSRSDSDLSPGQVPQADSYRLELATVLGLTCGGGGPSVQTRRTLPDSCEEAYGCLRGPPRRSVVHPDDIRLPELASMPGMTDEGASARIGRAPDWLRCQSICVDGWGRPSRRAPGQV